MHPAFYLFTNNFTAILGSFDLPLKGSGERYGESVSTNILSTGSSEKVFAKEVDFLNVIIPLADM